MCPVAGSGSQVLQQRRRVYSGDQDLGQAAGAVPGDIRLEGDQCVDSGHWRPEHALHGAVLRWVGNSAARSMEDGYRAFGGIYAGTTADSELERVACLAKSRRTSD